MVITEKETLMSKIDEKMLRRREFLKATGIAGAATGAAVVALSGTSVKATELKAGTKSAYRETEHIKKYYELARF